MLLKLPARLSRVFTKQVTNPHQDWEAEQSFLKCTLLLSLSYIIQSHTHPHTHRMIVVLSCDSGGRQCLSTQRDGDADR